MTDATDRDARTGSTAESPTGAKGPDELRQQIERTRGELGDTVEELAAKANVKGRAKARAADLKDKADAMTVQVRSTAAQAKNPVRAARGHPRVALAAGVAAGTVIVTAVLRRRHHEHALLRAVPGGPAIAMGRRLVERRPALIRHRPGAETRHMAET